MAIRYYTDLNFEVSWFFLVSSISNFDVCIFLGIWNVLVSIIYYIEIKRFVFSVYCVPKTIIPIKCIRLDYYYIHYTCIVNTWPVSHQQFSIIYNFIGRAHESLQFFCILRCVFLSPLKYKLQFMYDKYHTYI